MLVRPRSWCPENHQLHQQGWPSWLQARCFPRSLDSGLPLLDVEGQLPAVTSSAEEVPRELPPNRL